MSTEIQSIISAVRDLSAEQRRELAAALALLDGEQMATTASRQELVRSIRGKYRHVRTSSEAFLQRKADDAALES